MFKNSKWIREKLENAQPNTKDTYTDGSTLLRHEFEVSKQVKNAVMNVCGLGYGVYSVNGKEVTDAVLTTPPTKFDARVYYSSYDVTDKILCGKNAVGIYLGNGWFNDNCPTWELDEASWRDSRCAIMQLDIEYDDGTIDTVVTDTSWKAAEGPSVYNHIREGEIYDSRLEQPGWDKPGFDDSSWDKAVLCRGAGGVMEQFSAVPVRIIRSLKPEYLGGGIYDFKENISGWAEIEVSGNSGDEIRLSYSERYENGDIDNEHISLFTFGKVRQENVFILNGSENQKWHPVFVYHGFRYIKVENAPENFKIRAHVVHTDLQQTASFESGNEMVNKIHEAAVRSIITNFCHIPTDCPHREQNGWTGDALLSCEQSNYNFDMIKSYKRWLNDFKDAQRLNGQLPGIIPTSGWGYNWGSGPAWDSAIIQIPYITYKITGNDELIKQMWENMELYINYMYTMSEDYIVNYGLGDWCPPKKNHVECESVITDTAYYYANAQIMAKCAEIIGKDSIKYCKLADNIKNAFRKNFLHDGEIRTKDGKAGQTSIACGIYQGLYNDDEKPTAAAKLAQMVAQRDYHTDCGVLGIKYIFTALSEYGYGDVLLKMITNPTMPSYAYWIMQGMTTFCESWEMVDSCNHHMYSEVETWFYKHVAGIQPNADKLVIKPCFIKDFGYVKATWRETCVYWDEKTLKISLPKAAEVVIGGKVTSVGAGEHEFDISEYII